MDKLIKDIKKAKTKANEKLEDDFVRSVLKRCEDEIKRLREHCKCAQLGEVFAELEEINQSQRSSHVTFRREPFIEIMSKYLP